MKRKYVRPEMVIVPIKRQRILVGSDKSLQVQRSSGKYEDTEVGW